MIDAREDEVVTTKQLKNFVNFCTDHYLNNFLVTSIEEFYLDMRKKRLPRICLESVSQMLAFLILFGLIQKSNSASPDIKILFQKLNNFYNKRFVSF